jgi:hypothetical protein
MANQMNKSEMNRKERRHKTIERELNKPINIHMPIKRPN